MKITPYRHFQGWGLSTYAALAWRTARYQVEGEEHLKQAHATGRPYIIAAWHGMTMMLGGYLVTQEDSSQYMMIAPDDHRGATLIVWARRMGMSPFVISMEATSMVAGRRLLELIREMKGGKKLIVNPDGPDGPTHEPKKGVVFIARKAGSLIVPAGAFTTLGYKIPRWDRYTVPYPFSRIAVTFGPPFEVPRDADPEEMRLLLRERLNQAEQAAEKLYSR